MGSEWILGRLAWGVWIVCVCVCVCVCVSTVSGQEPVAGCCECGDEPSGSCATELVSYFVAITNYCNHYFSLHN
jgi:hypothetical protein